MAEGARSNVFVERNGVLLTPPESSGALPGVLRAELLAAGLAQEAVLQPGDLGPGLLAGQCLARPGAGAPGRLKRAWSG